MSNGNKRGSAEADDSGDAPSSKRQCHDYDNIKTEIRLLLPSKNVGAVIGKGGENIKRIRQEFQASISLPDSHGPERLMLVRGNVGEICGIVGDVAPLIDKERGDEEDVEIRMLVHQSHAGRIIGKGGSRVKELKEETDTNVKVFSDCAPQSTERVCLVAGKLDNVVGCVGRILEMLDGTPILGASSPYNPDNFDESYASHYGGFTGFRGGPPGGRGSGRDRFDRGGDRRGGRDFDRGRRDFGRGGRDFGGRGDFDRMVGGAGLLGAGFGGGLGAGLEALAMRNMLGSMSKTTTSQVSVPRSLAGAIIGKGGSNIRKVQDESGTVIKMDDPEKESEERIITIHGTQEQIQYAQYLLQMTVKQYAGGR